MEFLEVRIYCKMNSVTINAISAPIAFGYLVSVYVYNELVLIIEAYIQFDGVNERIDVNFKAVVITTFYFVGSLCLRRGLRRCSE